MSHIRMVRIFAVVVAVSLIADQCFAQPPQGQGGRQRNGQQGGRAGGFGGFGGGFGRGGGMDKLRLLGIEEVQKELSLTEEQVVSVKETIDGYREETRAIAGPQFDFRGLRDLPEEERAAKMKEFETTRAEVEKKRNKVKDSTILLIEASLESDQVKRLGQIELQQKGIKALIEDAMIAKLKLTTEQVTKIKDIFKTQDEKLAKIRTDAFGGFGGGRGGAPGGRGAGGGRPQRPTGDDQTLVPTEIQTYNTAFVAQQQGGNRQGGNRQGGGANREEMAKRLEEMQKKTAEVNKETEKLVYAVLTDGQKKQYEELKGEKFELDLRAVMARGRGGNQQGRTRGGNQGGGRGRGGDQGGGRPQRPGADN